MDTLGVEKRPDTPGMRLRGGERCRRRCRRPQVRQAMLDPPPRIMLPTALLAAAFCAAGGAIAEIGAPSNGSPDWAPVMQRLARLKQLGGRRMCVSVDASARPTNLARLPRHPAAHAPRAPYAP